MSDSVPDGNAAPADRPTERNVASVAKVLGDPASLGLSRGQRVGMQVARVVGNLPSLTAHAVAIAGWIAANRVMRAPFDPYPFAGLATLLAAEAIVLTLFILMNQAAMARQEDRRSHLDLQVNLLAEQEATTSLAMLQRICERLQIDVRDLHVGHGLKQLATKTDVDELMEAVDTQL